METDILKKKLRAIDLALAAGQRGLSPRTRLIHHAEFSDLIPIYENFCYAFALFRQRTTDAVLDAKELIGKLLGFQTSDGNFPIYLHDYPKAYDYNSGLKIAPILAYVLRLYPNVLGDLKPKIEQALEKILSKEPEKFAWKNRFLALKGLPLEPDDELAERDWTEWLITMQIAGFTEFSLPYEPDLQLFKIPYPQEGFEPRPHPIEWLLAEGNYSSRLLKDHPHQLLCAPLFPIQYTPIELPNASFALFWKGTTLHSLVGDGLLFNLSDGVEMGRTDLFEALLYCDRSNETEIFIKGRRGTTFQLGDKIAIRTPQKIIEITFHLTEGNGDFCGHIFPGNRSSQIAKGFDAYDWQIGLRTLRRSSKARIEIDITT